MPNDNVDNDNAHNDNLGLSKCPVCSARAAGDYKPFCSKRCADIDLHRWLSEGYAIPAVELDDEDAALISGEAADE